MHKKKDGYFAESDDSREKGAQLSLIQRGGGR